MVREEEKKEEYKAWKRNIENCIDTHMSIRQTDAFRAYLSFGKRKR